MQNFYTPQENFTDKNVRLLGEEYFHAARSCRVKVGELVGVTDGLGKRVHARIEEIDKHSLTAVIERDVSDIGEPDAEITIALSIIDFVQEDDSTFRVRYSVTYQKPRCAR